MHIDYINGWCYAARAQQITEAELHIIKGAKTLFSPLLCAIRLARMLDIKELSKGKL
jgi:hypothetical protein